MHVLAMTPSLIFIKFAFYVAQKQPSFQSLQNAFELFGNIQNSFRIRVFIQWIEKSVVK
jgi:hypothetical protein